MEKEYTNYDRIHELAEKTGQTKYKEYKIFNRNVLSKVKEELNKKTSLNIDYEPIKSGRKTVGIRFFVNQKETAKATNNNLPIINKDEILDELIEILHSDFKVKEIREIAEFAEYNIDKIKKSYEYMQSYEKTIEIPIAFIKECIKNEYYLNNAKPMQPKNSFNNFEQSTDNNFEELEKLLLDN